MNSDPLTPFRRRLRLLRWARQLMRFVGALSLCVAATLVAVAIAMTIDWALILSWHDRLVPLGVAVFVAMAAFSRWMLPAMRHRETNLDLALAIEQQQGIENDLVAALEFDSPNAPTFGSRQLKRAVIEYVADASDQLHFSQRAQIRSLLKRFAIAAVVLVPAVVIAWAWPLVLGAAFDRALLLETPYPSNTQINALTINQQPVDFDRTSNRPVTMAYGRSAVIEVHATGHLPGAGRIELRNNTDGTTAEVGLMADASRPGVYTAMVSRLVDSAEYRVCLGDARSAPQAIEVIPRPAVSIDFRIKPPAYVVDAGETERHASSRQLSVVEGTNLSIEVTCMNKPLKEASIVIAGRTFELVPANRERRSWTLPSKGTPLDSVREPLQYEIEVTDDDGLQLAEPLRGYIRTRADRPPRISATLVTQHVLPTAKPKLIYGAADDYGIAELHCRREVLHSDGTTYEDSQAIPLGAKPEQFVHGRFILELESLHLAKGDEVKVTFEARDYRGSRPGKKSAGEPLVLHVTDQRGVLTAMSESDERTARQMDAIIQRQLGIGND